MTAFPFRFRFFWAVSSLSLLSLTLMLLLPTEAFSVQLPQAARLRVPVDELQTVEVPNPHGSDPLTPREIDRIKQTTNASDIVKRARARAASSGRPAGLNQSLDVVQILYTQRHIEGKSANSEPQSRKTDVFYYNYSTNEVIRVVAGVDDNTIHETQVARGVANQPFFIGSEIKAALQLVFEHPELGPRLQRAYQEITGQNLTDVSQLVAQGGIFFPDSAANTPLEDITSACALDRCMTLFITIDDTSFIDMSNVVVNLSTGEILSSGKGLTGHTH